MSELFERTIDGLMRDGDLDDPRSELWGALHEHGLLQPFQSGLASWSEAGALIRAASRHAPGIPFAESVAGSYLLRGLGATPDAALNLTWIDPFANAPLRRSPAGVSGRSVCVPHAAVSSLAFAEVAAPGGPSELGLIELRGVEAVAVSNIAREPRDTLTLRDVPLIASTPTRGRSALAWLGALTRATQIAGLAEGVLGLALEHARTRRQFGSLIGSFQAVQHQLATLGCEVAALDCAVQVAERALDALGTTLDLEQAGPAIAAAKIQAGLTARSAVEVGHAVLAAIGYTHEHRLHRYSLRLSSYRAELGAERVHAAWLGERAIASGSDGLWDNLVIESRTVNEKE